MKIAICEIASVSEAEYRAWFAMMSPQRREQCLRLSDPAAQKRCIAVDHLARTLLGNRLNCSLCEVQINTTPAGKPYPADGSLYISLSHSAELAVCALSDHPVGIDVERIRPVSEAVQTRICNAREISYLNSAETFEDREHRFFRLWTRKEAMFKFYGDFGGTLRDLPALNPEQHGINVTTKQLEGYTISVAEPL